MSLSSPDPQSHTRVYLQVGERMFITSSLTLTQGSPYFVAAFSSYWQNSQSSIDTPYWIDADPNVFVHVLRYLRDGALPIIYKKSHGFDYGFYSALQKQAAYFFIKPLEKWIQEKCYLRAVVIHYSVAEMEGEHTDVADVTVEGNVEREYHSLWSNKNVYRCPRNISAHMGNANACGRACREALRRNGGYVEQEVLRTLIVTKKIVFIDQVNLNPNNPDRNSLSV